MRSRTPSTAITTRCVGAHSTRVRITDDAGATTVLRTDLFVHLENLPPRVAIEVTPADPGPGEPVTVSARASDPDGPPPGLAFDLDGDGTYETDPGEGTSVVTTLRRRRPARGRRPGARRGRDGRAPERARRDGAARAHAARRSCPAGRRRDLPRERGRDVGRRRRPVPRSTHAFASPGTYEIRARASDGRVAMRTVTVEADTGLPPAVTSFTLPVGDHRRSPRGGQRGRDRPGRRPADVHLSTSTATARSTTPCRTGAGRSRPPAR